jgi:hypothetical protein
MCRSIKTLRPPYADQVTDQDVRAAALQYVRKISGFRAPAARNAAAFDAAVDEIAATTARLLGALEVRPAAKPSPPAPPGRMGHSAPVAASHNGSLRS